MLSFLTVMAVAALELTPLPQQAELDDDSFVVGFQTPVVLADDASPSELDALSALFKAIGYELPIIRARDYDDNDGAIFIGEPGRHASFDRRRLRKYGESLEDFSPEGYRLHIWKKGVVLAGRTAEGTFHGIQTLHQIARQSPLNWPCLDIRDWPDFAQRGVVVRGTLSRPRLASLAELKCNWVLFDSTEFLALDERRAAAWSRVFQDARDLHIEPVPVVEPFRDAGSLLVKQPAAVEGRLAEDRLALSGDTWVPLSRPNALVTESNPVEVSISGLPCTYLEDYVVEPGDLDYPYLTGGRPCRIRRVLGGAIPDGATVTVRYAYAPPHSASLCSNALETEALLDDVLGRVIASLHPKYIHVGHGAPARLNQDLRCHRAGLDDAATRGRALALLERLAARHDPGVELLHWRGADTVTDSLRIAVGVRGMRLAMVEGERSTVYADVMKARAMGALGVLADAPDVESGGVRTAMEKAWSVDKPVLPWPEAFNDVFGAQCWSPTYAERRSALTAALNAAVLSGNTPEDVWTRFEDAVDRLQEVLPDDNRELTQTSRLLEVLVRYLELESEYARDDRPSLPRGLEDLVEAQAGLDPDFDSDRRDRIIETIERQGLFVPASILFGEQLLYYRPSSPAGLVEVQPEVSFHDAKHRAEALCDLGGLVGPVARIDLETVGARRVVLESSADGVEFNTAGEWVSSDGRGVRGPLLPRDAILSRFLRVTVESSSEQAVLRELRLFAFPPQRTARCEYTSSITGPAQRYSDVDWPSVPQVIGFRDTSTATFSDMPTEVHLCRSRTHLYIGFSAHEARPEALVAGARGHDAPVLDEESVSVVLRPDDHVYEFAVNPLGTHYDSEDGDTGWDGTWHAAAETVDGGWRAVLSIPLKQFGEAPRPGDTWAADFVRHRRNVRSSISTWTGTESGGSGPAGALVFR